MILPLRSHSLEMDSLLVLLWALSLALSGSSSSFAFFVSVAVFGWVIGFGVIVSFFIYFSLTLFFYSSLSFFQVMSRLPLATPWVCLPLLHLLFLWQSLMRLNLVTIHNFARLFKMLFSFPTLLPWSFQVLALLSSE